MCVPSVSRIVSGVCAVPMLVIGVRRVGEQETELRIADQRLSRSGNRVVDAALAVGREREREGPVGRGRPNYRVGQRRRREQRGEREEQLRNEPHHSISSITAA